jgi:hypothetical protein
MSGMLIAMCLTTSIAAQDTTDSKAAAEAARQGLATYVNEVLTEENVTGFGFDSLKIAKQAQLGTPYHKAMIGLTSLKAYQSGQTVESMLIDTKTMWWPVVVGGEITTKMEMILQEGTWIAGEFGGTRSVQSIVQASESAPRLADSAGIDTPYDIKLLEIPVLYAVFLYIKVPSGEYLIPAMIQPERLGFEAGRMYSADEVLSGLKPQAEKIDEGTIR